MNNFIQRLVARIVALESAIAGALGLSNATPQPPGVAAPGTGVLASRDDHAHAEQTNISGNAATATALQGGGADRIKLDGIASGATAEVNADATHAGRVTLGAQTLGTGTKTVDALVATGTVTGSNLSGTHSGTSSGTNTGDAPLTVKDEGSNLSTAVTSIDFVGGGVTATGTTAVTATIPKAAGLALGAIGSSANANAATLSSGTLNLEPATASFGGVVSTTTQTLGAGTKTVDALTSTGVVTAHGVTLSADGDWVGRSTNNSALFNSTTGDAVLRGSGSVYIAIDSNNDETTQKFVIQKDLNTTGGTELFSLTEAGVGALTGSLTVSSTLGVTGITKLGANVAVAQTSFTNYPIDFGSGLGNTLAAIYDAGGAPAGIGVSSADLRFHGNSAVSGQFSFRPRAADAAVVTINWVSGAVAMGAGSTMNAVDLLSQTNTVTAITGKSFSSLTHSGTLALGTSSVTGSWSFSGTPTIGGAATLSGTLTLSGNNTHSGNVTFSGNAIVYPGQTGITAFAGGGQASATALTKDINFVTTVATTNDSVKLPTAALALSVTVYNLGASSLRIYPASGGAIDSLGTNVGYDLAAGQSATFEGQSTTQWRSKGPAAAGTLTGTTLASNVVTSSLTSVGTITSGTWQGTAVADSYIASASTWNAKAASGANTDITSVALNQTGLAIKGGDSNKLTIKPNETMTAGRTLNVKVNDVDRTVDLSGDLTVSAAATVSGTNTGDELGHVTETLPSTPASGITFYAKHHARNFASFVDPGGVVSRLMPFVGHAAWCKPVGGGTTTFTANNATINTTGTSTGAAWANTSALTKLIRVSIVSAASAGSQSNLKFTSAGWYATSGYHASFKFGLTTQTATYRWFVGTKGGAFANADPSATINCIGVGQDSGDTLVYFMVNDGSGTCTKTTTGLSTPAATDLVEVNVYVVPGSSSAYISVAVNNGTPVELNPSTNLPAGTQVVNPNLWCNNDSTASACAFDMVYMYIEEFT